MSRLEKTLNDKNCKKKSKSIYRTMFMFIMIIITVGSIFLIDYRVNEVLGDDSKNNLIKYLNIF